MVKSPTIPFSRAPVVALVLASMLWLAGCGGSGHTTGHHDPSSEAASKAAARAVAEAAKKLGISEKTQVAAARVGVTALAGCLREHGIKVPLQSLSSSHPAFDLSGIDKGSAQFRAHYQPCLSDAIARYKARLYQDSGDRGGSTISLKTRGAAARIGVVTLTGCLQKHGVKTPPQDLSVPHPVFNDKGLNLKAPQVVAGMRACVHIAAAAYNARLHKR